MNDALIKSIMDKGIKNIDASMFPPQQREEIFMEVGKRFLNMGKSTDAFIAFDIAGKLPPIETCKTLAKNHLEIGNRDIAAFIYEKIGEKQLADFIRKNKI